MSRLRKIMLFASLMLFVCLLSYSASAEKIVHKAWHEYIDVFSVDGKVIDIRLGESEDSLLRIKVDNISALLEYGKCITFDTHTVCYTNRSVDVAQASISNSGQTMPGVYITVSKEDDILTDMSITHSLTKINILEDYKVNITFKNKKSEWIDSFNYEVTLPNGVVVSDLGDFIKIGSNKLLYTGSISSNSQKIVSFTVKSSTTGLKKANYTISMTSNNIKKEAKNTFNFDFVNPFTLTVTMPSTSNILDDSKVVINLKNTGNFDLELVNLTITGSSEDLDYFAGTGLEIVRPGVYSTVRSEIIKQKLDKEYYMVITPLATGKHNITFTLNVNYNGGSTVYVLNKTLVSSISGFTPIFEMSKDAVLSGSEVELYYEISNSNPSNTFRDIYVTISGEFISENLSLARLGAAESVVLLRKFIDVPYLDKDKSYKVVATTNYVTQSGERKQVNTTRNLKVTSNGSLISLSHKLSPVEVYAGQDVIVEVNIKNLKDELFEVGANEVVPSEVEKIGGIVWRNFTLKGLGSDSAYVYKLHIPESIGIQGFNVTTIGRVESKGYETSVSSYIKIKRNTSSTPGKTVKNSSTDINPNDIVVIKNSSYSVPDDDGDEKEEKKDTAFRRFFRGIETFFVNLFS